MAIRPARESDVGALQPLIRAYCDFYEADPASEGLEEMTRALIAAPDDEGFLFCATADDDAVVGFAGCGWKWSSLAGARIVVLEDLFVDPAARGKGHADALIAACAGVAREHGAPTLSWLTAPDNKRAQAVYDRVGGEPETMIEYMLKLDRDAA
jgi:GNAT superfamily N-acetyltransferase